jgi:hypothetical protein
LPKGLFFDSKFLDLCIPAKLGGISSQLFQPPRNSAASIYCAVLKHDTRGNLPKGFNTLHVILSKQVQVFFAVASSGLLFLISSCDARSTNIHNCTCGTWIPNIRERLVSREYVHKHNPMQGQRLAETWMKAKSIDRESLYFFYVSLFDSLLRTLLTGNADVTALRLR